ncbi:hypothetical protein HJFPF1_08201 [Paramyrothecium foliicola]|nr:hypothetical protein HJFPF1_08201 [Paramyrothecium foliicola]
MSATLQRSSSSAAHRLFLLSHEMTRSGASFSAEERLAWHKSVASMPNPYSSSQQSAAQRSGHLSQSASLGSTQTTSSQSSPA